MPWDLVTDENRLAEWKRSDGYATIRLRERPDGRHAVRFDRLHQAPAGKAYRRETVPNRDEATSLVAEWKEAFDGDDT